MGGIRQQVEIQCETARFAYVQIKLWSLIVGFSRWGGGGAWTGLGDLTKYHKQGVE